MVDLIPFIAGIAAAGAAWPILDKMAEKFNWMHGVNPLFAIATLIGAFAGVFSMCYVVIELLRGSLADNLVYSLCVPFIWLVGIPYAAYLTCQKK